MNNKGIMLLRKKFGAVLTAVLLLVVMFYSAGCADKSAGLGQDLDQFDVLSNSTAGLQDNVDVPGAVGENVVEVTDGNSKGGSEDKMVVVAFENAGRANPFLPARESGNILTQKELFKFDLIEPPTTPQPDTQASKIVTTKISGIMFDNYNPSAILNIEGNDYLVRSGDVINGYKILAISPSTVTVQLGKNVYKAGVGEVVTEGDVNYNTISNLSSKFGGNTGNKKK